jgi:hypothetical protein
MQQVPRHCEEQCDEAISTKSGLPRPLGSQ